MNERPEQSVYSCNGNLTKDNNVTTENNWKEENHERDDELISKGSDSTRPTSTMKDTYRYPLIEERKIYGERHISVMKKMYEEATAEVIRELNEPPPVEEYCTEYDENYNIPGCPSENEHHTNKELSNKYPLYKSPAISYWNFKLETNQIEGYFPGFTGRSDLKNPFKRSANFTKPLSEVRDESFL